MRTYGVEVFGVAPDPGGSAIRVGLALYLYVFAPVVGLHRGVGADAHLLDAGDGVEPVFDGSIEGFNLGGSVTCCLRVEMTIYRFVESSLRSMLLSLFRL